MSDLQTYLGDPQAVHNTVLNIGRDKTGQEPD